MSGSEKTCTQPSRTSNILMLHGNGQSGESFKIKTRQLREIITREIFASLDGSQKVISGGIEFVYPDAPLSAVEFLENVPDRNNEDCEDNDDGIVEENEPCWRVWGYGAPGERVYGVERAMLYLANIINTQGPFIGVIGFSTGAALASVIAAVLEGGRLIDGLEVKNHQPPLSFVIGFSGFKFYEPEYSLFYSPKLRTPALHFAGTLDSHIPTHFTLDLARTFEHAHTQLFMGTHLVPYNEEVAEVIITFVKHALGRLPEYWPIEASWEDVS